MWSSEDNFWEQGLFFHHDWRKNWVPGTKIRSPGWVASTFPSWDSLPVLMVISYLHFSCFFVVAVFWFWVLILESRRSVNPKEYVPDISNEMYGSLRWMDCVYPGVKRDTACSEAGGSTRKDTDMGWGKSYLSVSDAINLEAAAIKKCVRRRRPLGLASRLQD